LIDHTGIGVDHILVLGVSVKKKYRDLYLKTENKMKKIIVLIISVTLLMSCSKKEDTKNNNSDYQKEQSDKITESLNIKQSHEILNLILERWAPLSNQILERENGDTIPINEIVLVPLSYTDLRIDSTKNGFSIIPHKFGIKTSPKFQEIRDTLLKQIKESKPIKWDSRLIYSTIKIEPNVTEKKVSFPSQIHDKNSFLILSEPFKFDKNLYFVSGLLYTKKKLLDILYIVEKENNKFKIVDVELAILRLVVENKKAVRQKDGSTKRRILTVIFDGYE